MRDEHHRAFVSLDQALEVALARQVEVIVRLVQQQHIRRRKDQARQSHQFLLSAAQHRQRFVEFALFQSQPAEQAAHPLRILVAPQRLVFLQQFLLTFERRRQLFLVRIYLGAAQPGFDRCQLSCHLCHAFTACQGCIERGQRRVQCRFLRQVPHRNAFRPHHRSARLGRVLAHDHLEQRRLARPVGSDQPDLLILPDLPGKVLEDRLCPQDERDVVE